MAGRGYGRRGGRGGRAPPGQYKPPLPFVLYPEDINLPDAKLDIDDCTRRWLKWNYNFDSYFKVAPYFLEEEEELKGCKRMHIETYSDKKKNVFTRDSLSQILYFDGLVKELVPGKSKRMASQKKFRWNPESETKTKVFFAELEKKLGQVAKDKKENKEESEEENESEEEHKESDGYSTDDYNQNQDFDDDDDDFNAVEEEEDIM